MQYGIDTAAVGGLQAMPGFLKVFGYEDPTSPLGYGIDVSHQTYFSDVMEAESETVDSSATHDVPDESWRRGVCYCSGCFWRVFWEEDSAVACVCCLFDGSRDSNWFYCSGGIICRTLLAWVCEWVLRGVFHCVLQ